MNRKRPGYALFALLTAAILLTGAAASGLAAWAVVEPQAGQVQSAGQLSVPTVLGQTADEVLFYPWSVYDQEPKKALATEKVDEQLESYSLNFLVEAMAFLGAEEIDPAALRQAMECSVDAFESEKWAASYVHLYAKDYPCRLYDGTAAVLNYAESYSYGDTVPDSITCLVRPEQQQELSQAQQDAALERVEADLKEFLLCGWEYGGNEIYMNLTETVNLLNQYEYLRELGRPAEALLRIVQWSFGVETDVEREYYPVADGTYTLPQLSEMLEYGANWSTQLITTPSQVVILMSSGTLAVGVYYDIQLERYSGFGIQAG